MDMPAARATHGDHMTRGRHHGDAMALVVAARCGVALVRKSDIFLVGLRLLRGDVTPHLFEVEILVAQKKKRKS